MMSAFDIYIQPQAFTDSVIQKYQLAKHAKRCKTSRDLYSAAYSPESKTASQLPSDILAGKPIRVEPKRKPGRPKSSKPKPAAKPIGRPKGSVGKRKRKLLEEAQTQTQPQQGAEPPPQQDREAQPLQDDDDSPLLKGERLRRRRFCFRTAGLSLLEVKQT